MKIYDAIIHAARFSVSPTFTLFGVTSKGDYTLIITDKVVGVFGSKNPEIEAKAKILVERFKSECFNHDGLEVRVDGVRVQFD